MSLFMKLVQSSIEQGCTGPVARDIHRALLNDSEQVEYEFVMRHLRRYGSLPSESTLRNNRFDLGVVSEPPTYYVDRIKARFAYNVINEKHPALAQAMKEKDMGNAVTILRDMLSGIGSTVEESSHTTLAAEAQSVIDEYDQRKWQTGLCGITFGWPTMDNATLGAMGGDLIVLAGRPSVGKSWLLCESAFKAWKSGASIAVVSMEMGKKQLVRRFMGRDIGVNPNFIRSGRVGRWVEKKMKQYPQQVIVQPRMTIVPGDMTKGVESLEPLMEETMPDILYVDSAYLMTTQGRKGRLSKWEMIAEVIHAIKALSIKYDRPAFITVQFNRNRKSNSRAEADLSDIAGTDAIPQDASIVGGVKYGPPPFEKVQREVDLIKNREGETPSFRTGFTFSPPNMEEVTGNAQETMIDTEWMV